MLALKLFDRQALLAEVRGQLVAGQKRIRGVEIAKASLDRCALLKELGHATNLGREL